MTISDARLDEIRHEAEMEEAAKRMEEGGLDALDWWDIDFNEDEDTEPQKCVDCGEDLNMCTCIPPGTSRGSE